MTMRAGLVTPEKMGGHEISLVLAEDGSTWYRSKSKVPDGRLGFDLIATGAGPFCRPREHFVVLSNHADNRLKKRRRREFFGSAQHHTVAIHRRTGWMYYVHFSYQHDSGYTAWLHTTPGRNPLDAGLRSWVAMPRIPRAYVERTKSLLASEEPYFCYSDEPHLLERIRQTEGYVASYDKLVISLDLRLPGEPTGTRLEVSSGGLWRTVGKHTTGKWSGVMGHEYGDSPVPEEQEPARK
jgi:hypothetical protein